jgi:CheY-like chemotaxis protein
MALLVAHDSDTRELYSDFLTNNGYAVALADDGREALAKVASYRDEGLRVGCPEAARRLAGRLRRHSSAARRTIASGTSKLCQTAHGHPEAKLHSLSRQTQLPPKTHHTNQPDPPAPELFCPICQRPLFYERTAFSGVPTPERWDEFFCRWCGRFEYRHRTQSLRRIEESP